MIGNAQVVEVMDQEVFIPSHGNAITPEDAYRAYISTGARSLRRTADLLGIPHGTILSWNKRYQWQARVRAADIESTEGLAQMAAVAAVAQGVKSLEVLARIRDDEDVAPMARVESAKELLRQFNGITALVAGSALTKGVQDDLGDAELEELASNPDGVQKLLEMQRQLTGRG